MMATNGINGVTHTYALSETHKNVSVFWNSNFTRSLINAIVDVGEIPC